MDGLSLKIILWTESDELEDWISDLDSSRIASIVLEKVSQKFGHFQGWLLIEIKVLD